VRVEVESASARNGRVALRALLAGAVAAVLLAFLTVEPAAAHPLGNFTVNTSLTVVVGTNEADVRLVVDMAEIPALQTKQQIAEDGRSPSAGELDRYASSACAALATKTVVGVGGRVLPLEPEAAVITLPPGQAGLTTLRLECSSRSPVKISERVALTARTDAYGDRVGWREIVIAGDGTTVTRSDAPTSSPSATLTAYPTDLKAPLRQQRASATVRPGGARLRGGAVTGLTSPLPRGVDGATRAFASFVARQDLGFGVAAAALALSLLLGAIHALAPGHGKTVMAAYLVGQKGSPRQAAMLGLTVTATHTLGVLALGVAIAASKLITPERLYPYLGTISGLLLAAIGLNLLRNAQRARRFAVGRSLDDAPEHAHHDHDHPHDHDHDHDHEPVRELVAVGASGGGVRAASAATAPVVETPARTGELHAHGGSLHRHDPIVEGQPLTWSSLLALGFVGGFLPSPSAVVVLVGAIALGRAWFGVLLVVAYGLGMATTLMLAGLLLVRARGVLERRLNRLLDRDGSRVLNTILPFGTALVIVVVGLVLATQGAMSVGR
jgi:ABC-type nickel/cobalt efflux system permease component RcnA